MGAIPDASYQKTELQLNPGESVLFYTDGVIEAQNERMEFLGNCRLAEFIAGKKNPPWGKPLLDTVRQWQGNMPNTDDVTLLEIWRE